jgi:hypothetical protein
MHLSQTRGSVIRHTSDDWLLHHMNEKSWHLLSFIKAKGFAGSLLRTSFPGNLAQELNCQKWQVHKWSVSGKWMYAWRHTPSMDFAMVGLCGQEVGWVCIGHGNLAELISGFWQMPFDKQSQHEAIWMESKSHGLTWLPCHFSKTSRTGS